jgi:transcriptional regulator with XRE-family HTH domain
MDAALALLLQVGDRIAKTEPRVSRSQAREPERRTIGAALRRARERRKLTLQQAADQVRISPSVLSRIENGLIAEPKLRLVARLAEVLSFSLDDIAWEVGYVEQPASKRRLTSDGLDESDLVPIVEALRQLKHMIEALRTRARRR